MGCIYKIENKINGKCYIGQAHNYQRRFKQHLNKYKQDRYIREIPKLYNSMRKYGEDAFTFEILIFIPNILLNIWERFYIRLFNSVKNGYNTFERGNTSFGFKHSEESKKKISLKAMGNQRMVGKKLSEDTKQKISKSLKGFRHSPDTIAKMSKVKMGRYVSDETRLKLKEIMKNRIGKIKYILKSPSGEIVEFLNLKKFCDENNLKIKSIRGIIFGERNSAHGWEFIDKIKN